MFLRPPGVMDVCAFGSWTSAQKLYFPALRAMGWKYMGRDVCPDIRLDVRGRSRPDLMFRLLFRSWSMCKLVVNLLQIQKFMSDNLCKYTVSNDPPLLKFLIVQALMGILAPREGVCKSRWVCSSLIQSCGGASTFLLAWIPSVLSGSGVL